MKFETKRGVTRQMLEDMATTAHQNGNWTLAAAFAQAAGSYAIADATNRLAVANELLAQHADDIERKMS